MLSQNSCSFMHDQKKNSLRLHRLQYCGVIVYFHVSGNKKTIRLFHPNSLHHLEGLEDFFANHSLASQRF